ncbi:MAG: HAMP domain-containing sensor histidine kinase [Pseudomonadota bacterium]
MRVQTRILVSSVLLLALLIAASGTTFWVSDQTRRTHELAVYAYSELQSHKLMSVRLAEIERGISLAVDMGLSRLPAEVLARVDEVNDLIAQDVARHDTINADLVNVDAVELRIPKISWTMESLFEPTARKIAELDALLQDGAPYDQIILIRSEIEEAIRSSIEPLLNEHMDSYRTTFEGLLMRNDRLHGFFAAALSAFSIVAVIVGVVTVLFSLHRIRRGFQALEEGAERFAQGDLSHRIDSDGTDEIARLAQQFNAMAAEIKSDRHLLESHRRSLEDRVTDRTKELAEANESLLQRERQRRIFFADLGHELRTPLTVMRGEAEIALRARRDREVAYGAALNRVVDISDQLTRLVNDIFLIARAQSGMLDLRERELDFVALVSTSVAEMHNWIQRNGGVIALDLPEREVFIEGDETRLMQVLRILLTNAVQHGGEAPKVEVSLTQDGPDWRLSVSDNGPGVSEPDRERVFNRFYKGGGSGTTPQFSNTGLGLPIARTLVEAHGGRIWIDPSTDRGATFHLTIPALRAAPDFAPRKEETLTT